MGKCRESVRKTRRRKAWWEAQVTAMSDREPVSDEAAAEFLEAIERKRSAAFGIERLAKLDLDAARVGPVAKWVCGAGADRRMGLLRYAALRGRDAIVCALLRAGARMGTPAWVLDGDPAVLASVDDRLRALFAPTNNFRAMAKVVVFASRMAESAARAGGPVWRWAEVDRGRSEWRGCACRVPSGGGAAVWALFFQKTDEAQLECPACGARGMPSPLFRAGEGEGDPLLSSDDDDDHDDGAKNAAAKRAWEALDPRDRAIRVDRLHDAARRGDARKVKRLIREGCDVDAVDEFGTTALFSAALRRDDVCWALLIKAGADPSAEARSTPRGDTVTPRDLYLSPHPESSSSSSSSSSSRGLLGGRVEPLLTADAFVVHSAATEGDVELLLKLYALTPAAAPKGDQERGRQWKLERRHFVDASAWLDGVIRRSLPKARIAPRCKFVRYVEDGAEMAPHVDLFKSTSEMRLLFTLGPNEESRPPSSILAKKKKTTTTRTSHTWVLYLNTCPRGGATAMLRDLHDRTSTVDVVHPVKGRLLVFPHRTFHAGQPIHPNDPPKLIVRGDLLFLDGDTDDDTEADAARPADATSTNSGEGGPTPPRAPTDRPSSPPLPPPGGGGRRRPSFEEGAPPRTLLRSESSSSLS